MVDYKKSKVIKKKKTQEKHKSDVNTPTKRLYRSRSRETNIDNNNNTALLEDKYDMVKMYLDRWLMNVKYDGDVNKIQN